MADLYLQALMQGEIIKQGIKSVGSKVKKNRFEIEIEKQIDEYLKTIDHDDGLPNQFITPAMKIARMREEMKEEAKLAELSKYVEEAFKILNLEGGIYLSEDQLNALNSDFESANQLLNDLDLSNPITDNFKSILQLSDTTIESIISIAIAKYNEGHFSESLSLYVLLSTLSPEYSEYWYRAAISAQTNQNFELALKLYKAAFTLDPELIGAKIFAIDCCLNLNLLDDAKAAYNEAKSISETTVVEDVWKQILEEQESACA